MKTKRYNGFSLLELITVVVILVVLCLLIIGSGKKLLSQTRTAQCLSKMKSLSVAAHLYSSENNGSLAYYSINPNWMVNIAPYLGIEGPFTNSLPPTNAFLCPEDPSTSPQQLRTYRYNAATLSTTTTVSRLPTKISGVANPSTLGHFFCTAYTGNRLLPLWTFDTAIWREDVDNNNPPQSPGHYPRPHHRGTAVNVVYFDGHTEVTPYPLSPATFHFDGK